MSSMRAMLTASLSALALAGCQTLGGGSGTTLTMITSEPPGALVTVEGFGSCETPCTVEIDEPRNIVVAKAGYEPERLVLLQGRRKLNVVLKLSAPTTGVDETELPEL